MIKKETIIKTSVCYWSDEDDCFVVESPLFNRTAGIGATTKEAMEHFRHMVDVAYEDLKANKIAGLNKAGRPAKAGVQLSCTLSPDTLEIIKSIAANLEISQGEVVDLMAFFYSVRSGEKQEVPQFKEIMSKLKSIEKRIIPIGAMICEPRAEYEWKQSKGKPHSGENPL